MARLFEAAQNQARLGRRTSEPGREGESGLQPQEHHKPKQVRFFHSVNNTALLPVQRVPGCVLQNLLAATALLVQSSWHDPVL